MSMGWELNDPHALTAALLKPESGGLPALSASEEALMETGSSCEYERQTYKHHE